MLETNANSRRLSSTAQGYTTPRANRIALLATAWNQVAGVAHWLARAPRNEIAALVVIDRGSRDATAAVALDAGAHVVFAPNQSAGAAIHAGLAETRRLWPDVDVAVVVDMLTVDPQSAIALAKPVADGQADLVVGGLANRAGAVQSSWADRMACLLIGLRTGVRYDTVGAVHAASLPAFDRLSLSDGSDGWAVELQLKAARQGLVIQQAAAPSLEETPVGASPATAHLWSALRYSLARLPKRRTNRANWRFAGMGFQELG